MSERIALAVDLTPLDADAVDILGAERTDDAEAETTASILVLGLLNSVFPAIEESLLELGVSRRQLHEDWNQELDKALQERISGLLAANDHETACRLSEFKTKHLSASISSLAREKRDRDDVEPRSRQPRSGDARSAAAKVAQSKRVGSGIGSWVTPMREVALGKTQSGRRIRGGVAAAAFVSLVAALAFNFVQSEKVEVADLQARQLTNISPYLQSANRNSRGTGFLVIGRVDPEWHALEEHERLVAAEEMRQALIEEKVRDAMIYDADRRLQIQIAGGQLRKPAAVAGTPTSEQ